MFGTTKPVRHNYCARALQPGTATTELTHHNHKAHRPGACALQERPQQGEARAPQLESGPYSLQLEKACPATKTQHS